MDNRAEKQLKQLVDYLNDNLERNNKREMILLMQKIIELVECLKWDKKYNNTEPFRFVD